MPKDARPFVAIIGGFWTLTDPAEVNRAKETAREIGAAFASAGMGLVVYYSDDNCLEPHVVSGYVQALPAGVGAKSIRVRFAESQKNGVKFAEQATRDDLFDRSLFAGDDWEAPFYRSLVEADSVDAVLLMAGGRSTFIAGQIAMARPLPVLAVDAFTGAATSLRSELARRMQDYPSAATHTTKELVAWLKDKCTEGATQRAQARHREKHYSELISQQRKAIWVALAFFVLMATVYRGVARTPTPDCYTFLTLIGLTAAGATGALVRSVLWASPATASVMSLALGSIAGLAVGLAYLIPQWVGAPGVLAPSAKEVLPTDKIQFVSAVLVAISAGVGFDTVFTRMRKQTEDQPVGPPSQKQS